MACCLRTSFPLWVLLALPACGWPENRVPLAKRLGEGTLARAREQALRHDTASIAAAHRTLLENTPLSDLERKRREWGLKFCTAALEALDRQEYVLHEESQSFEDRFDDRYATFRVDAYVGEDGRRMVLTLPLEKARNRWLVKGGAPR